MEHKNMNLEEDLEIEIIDIIEENSSQIKEPQPMPSKPNQAFPTPVPNKPLESNKNPKPLSRGNDNVDSKKKGTRWILKFAIVLFIVCVGIVGGIYFYRSNTKRLLFQAIEELTANFANLSEPLKNSITTGYESERIIGTIDLNVKINLNEIQIGDIPLDYQKIVENINDLKITYDYQMDKENKNVLLNMSGNLHDTNVFAVQYLKVNNKQYVLLQNILENYIELDNAEVVSNIDINENINDIQVLWKIILKSLNKNIKSEYIKTERVTINLNQKEESVKKTTLNLTKQNQEEILQNLILDLKNNAEAVTIISKYAREFNNKDVEQIIKEMNIEEDFIFAIYYKDVTNNILMMELINENNNQKIVYTKDTENTIEILKNNEVIYQITFKIEDKKFTISTKDENDTIGIINCHQTEDGYIYTWNLMSNDNIMTGNYTFKQIIENNQRSVQRDFNIKIAQQGKEVLTLNIVDRPISTNDLQTIVEPTNTVKTSDLTEEETGKIMLGLFSVVTQLFGT